MRILYVLCMTYALLSGCQTRQRLKASASLTQGSQVDMTAADGFGLRGEMEWKPSVSSGQGVLPPAWAGDIWPTLQGGLSHRFVLPANGEASLSAHMHLSPAEKYDRLKNLLGNSSDATLPLSVHASQLAPLQTSFWRLFASKNAFDTQKVEGASDAIVTGLLRKAESDYSTFQSQRDLIAKDFKSTQTTADAPTSAMSYAQSRLELAKRHWDGQGALQGLSRGWAAAALVEKMPQSAVLFKHGEESILFTQADIQGLITLLWDEQAPIGSLQNLMACPDRGQPTEAWLCEGKSEGSCERGEGKPVFIRHDDSTKGMILYSETDLGNEARLAIIRQDLGQSAFSVATFKNPSEFETWFQKGGQGDKNSIGVMHVSGCHSPSPLLFHRAMLRMSASSRPLGLEMRLGGESLHLPLQSYKWRSIGAAGKESVIRVDEVSDSLRAYRAPGTVYLVQILMQLKAALPTFASQPVAAGGLGSMTVSYTLELDHEYSAIGGHWGLIPQAKETSFPVVGIPPKTLWSAVVRGEFRSGPIDATIVRRLHECSLETPKELVEMKTKSGLQKIPYVDCLMQ